MTYFPKWGRLNPKGIQDDLRAVTRKKKEGGKERARERDFSSVWSNNNSNDTDGVVYYFFFWNLVLSQDTILGFLLAGIGNVDIRRNTNYLVVDTSKWPRSVCVNTNPLFAK